MSKYALLGATGQVGRSVLKVLLESSTSTGTKKQINVLVRSRSRFEKQLQTHDFKSLDHSAIETFEAADVSDVEILARCTRGTRAVFMCVALAKNMPGCTIAQDRVKAVIGALQKFREDGGAGKLPRLVILSSAEAEIEPHFSKGIPRPTGPILYAANSNLYNDLIAAERYLRQHQDWVNFCIVKAGGLSWDIARGREVRFGRQQTFISYADLAGGMLEVADEESDKYDGKNLSVVSSGSGAKIEYSSGSLLLIGLMVHFFPALYSWVY